MTTDDSNRQCARLRLTASGQAEITRTKTLKAVTEMRSQRLIADYPT